MLGGQVWIVEYGSPHPVWRPAYAMGEKLDELLRREDNRALLKGFEDTLSTAWTALTDIERQEAEARLAREEVHRLEKRHDEICCYSRDAFAI